MHAAHLQDMLISLHKQGAVVVCQGHQGLDTRNLGRTAQQQRNRTQSNSDYSSAAETWVRSRSHNIRPPGWHAAQR